MGSKIEAPYRTVRQDRTGREVDDYLSQIDSLLGRNLEPAADPFQAMQLDTQSLGGDGVVSYGHIQYSLPYLGWYRVAFDDAAGLLPCCAVETNTSPGLIGPRSTSMYPPNTPVLVYRFRKPAGLYGIIIGAFPDVMSDGNVIFSDFHMQGSSVGLKRDGHLLSYINNLGDEGGAIDFSNHRPIDELNYDWGVMTETGIGTHIDPAWTYVRVSEVCGVFCNLYDQHLTVAGYNADYMSAMHTEVYRNDEGEHIYYRGEALYPWEQLGATSPDTTTFVVNTDEDVHLEKAVGKYEPKTMDQKPIARYEEYGGYLGQGHMRQMSLPPAADGYLHTDSAEDQIHGVFREQITPDGAIALSSAKSVIIAKRSLTSIAKRIKRPEDFSKDADSVENENYKFSGHYEAADGEDHAVRDFTAEGVDGHLISVAAILDLHAYTFNWKAIHPFHYHAKDYILPEESELYLESVQATPDFAQLQQSMWLPRPESKTLRVDHRYGDVAYYQVLSHLSMTDDGGVVLSGGDGCELRFVGGSIQFSCPGNMYLQPGKSLVALGGDDVIVRAKNSMDLSTSDGDMRFKAEYNQHFLSGNSGVGGTLVENRAQGFTQDYHPDGGEKIKSSGVVVKCPGSVFGTIVQEAYIRTDGGPIVLDASKGESEIKLVGSTVATWAVSSIKHNFINKEGIVKGVNEFGANSNLIGSRLDIDGDIKIGGGAQLEGGISLASGSFLSRNGDHVGKLTNVGLVQKNIDDVGTAIKKKIEEQDAKYISDIKERYYDQDKIGNSDVQSKVSFSLREEDEYGTTNFKLPQTQWQVLAEPSGAGNAWAEPVVEYQDRVDMMPWPGKKAWQAADGLLMFPADQFKIHDLESGRAKNRTDPAYESPTFGEFTPGKLEEKYKVLG